MKIYSFIIVLIVVAVSKTSFSNENDSIINKVFVLIYNDKYAEAHSEILANQTILGNFYSDVLTIDLLWWEYIRLDQNNGKQERFILFMEKFDTFYANNSELKLRQLIKNSYLIRHELKRYHIIKAINTRTALKRLLDELSSEELLFPENRMKLLGLYKTLFHYFDNVINPLFNKNKRELRRNALVQIDHFSKDNDLIIKTLSLYFLGKIYLNIEKDQESGIRCFSELAGYYPNNSLFKEVVDQNK